MARPEVAGGLGAGLRLLRVLKETRPDLIHVHSPRGLLQVVLAARAAGIPVVASVHLPVEYLIRGRGAVARLKLAAYRLLDRLVLRRRVARTIFVSRSVWRDSVARRLVLPDRAVLVPNGVELERFRVEVRRDEVRREIGVSGGAVLATFVGRLEAQKGADVLLESASILHLEALDLSFVIAGDGSLRDELEAYVRSHGLAGRVKFLGLRRDVERVLAVSDIFVLPSRFEAMPIALIEAMAAGVPSVVTDVGDNADLVSCGPSGVVVPPGDAPALAAAIERLARDPERRRRMGAEARAVAARHSVREASLAVERVYMDVLSAAGDFRPRSR